MFINRQSTLPKKTMLNSVTVTRSRRPNAGSRMARLLNEEEEDEFYTSAYGGFAEEEDDNDYESESSGHDSIDTDFVDTEEEDEGSANETGAGSDDEKKRRRTRRVVTKSYKEPKAKKDSSDKVKPEPKPRSRPLEEPSAELASEGRKLRASTVRAHVEAATDKKQSGNSEATALKRKALLAEIAQRKNLPEVRRLTQEELLAEAKITEEINKRSLARYQKLEIERKKIRVQKTVSQQPMIRTHSFAVPSVADQPEVYGVAVNSERLAYFFAVVCMKALRSTSSCRCLRSKCGSCSVLTIKSVGCTSFYSTLLMCVSLFTCSHFLFSSGDVEMRQMLVNRNLRCARTLVSFTDPASFTATFPSTAPGKRSGQAPRKKTRFCPLTGRVAAYLDPLTRTPYADLAAFRALRYLYRLHLETGTPAIDLLRQYRSGELRIADD
ncbi:unnamed protein product [Mesocestoides corti]|uniref:Vacuolar protein sorting-associated protein 72 homolog n=1 Tax=Mesocestoides corti TaxID=53468 RepID=A0A3P6GT07_MESCO|nr:unnamed protein product [Mesocestoides corti]